MNKGSREKSAANIFDLVWSLPASALAQGHRLTAAETPRQWLSSSIADESTGTG